MKGCILLTTLLAFPILSIADTTLPAQTISEIATGWSSNGVYYSFKDGVTVENCKEDDNRVVVDINHPMSEQMLSIALSAFHSGKQVEFRVSGCTIAGLMNGIGIKVIE